jgi:hypothetical protein
MTALGGARSPTQLGLRADFVFGKPVGRVALPVNMKLHGVLFDSAIGGFE